MCQACPGCALANPTLSKSSELVYNFLVKAPFLVMHFDAYAAGKHAGFEGSECYLLGCCGMPGFSCMEPIANTSATTFASAIMKILLRYGFCHTAVLDKDAKFFWRLQQSPRPTPNSQTRLIKCQPQSNVSGEVQWLLDQRLEDHV